MKKTVQGLTIFMFFIVQFLYAQPPMSYIPSDNYPTEKGNLEVTLVGHGSVMFHFDGNIIHVDPYSKIAEYTMLPKADLIILTHEHPDHLDKEAIEEIRKQNTRFIVTPACREILGYGETIENGGQTSFNGIDIEAVPAYNMIHKNPQGEFYHPKGRGNGYIFSFADKRVYVAGDTEDIPEMNQLENLVDIAFLPKNLPYTMTDAMFVHAAKMIKPNYLYPYHFSEFEEVSISNDLRNEPIQLIIRPMSNK